MDRAIHVVSKKQLVKWNILHKDGSINRDTIRHVYAGVDWGYTNPGVINIFGIDNDDRMYLLHETYRTGQTIDWWIDTALDLQHEFKIEQFACDPAEPAYIAQFYGAGLPAFGATNDIAPGISILKSRLQDAGDGRARFYVYEYALRERDQAREEAHKPYCFEQEVDAYVWAKSKDGQPAKEIPVDEHNHSIDPTRYVAMYLNDPTPTADDHIAALQQRLELQNARKSA